MIQNVFDGWDTSYALGRPPALSARQFDSSRIQVGILFQHHPLTTERVRTDSTSVQAGIWKKSSATDTSETSITKGKKRKADDNNNRSSKRMEKNRRLSLAERRQLSQATRPS